MQKKKLVFLLLLLSLFACEKNSNNSAEDYQISISAYKNVSLSKTALDPDDSTKTQWVVGDKIYMWADNSSQESILEAQEFSLKYFSTSYTQATFVSNISEAMADDTYNYYAVYPTPISYSGKQVTMNISSTQSGEYDGVNDILLANPFQGGALTEEPLDGTYINFKHLTHALRIAIPENPLGGTISKFVINFPCEVVGNLTFDVDNYNATPIITNGSSSITVELDQSISANDGYAWVFINPTELNGDLTIISFADNGYMGSNTVNINKTCAQGAVTPIALTPKEMERTSLTFNVKTNNLGETITAMDVTSPSGIKFIGHNDKETISLSSSAGFTLEYYDYLYGEQLLNSEFSIDYESANANVSGVATVTSLTAYADNTVDVTVPYLFSEDFSGIQTFAGTAANMSGAWGLTGDAKNPDADYITGADGFTASRTKGELANCVCVVGHLEGVKISTSYYNARMDSGALSNLKTSASVKILVSFNLSGNLTGNADQTPILQYGTTTTSGCINGETSIGTGYVGEKELDDYGTLNGSFDNVGYSLSYNQSGVGASTRLSFFVTTDDKSGTSNPFASDSQLYDYFYEVYIDNITVKIVTN